MKFWTGLIVACSFGRVASVEDDKAANAHTSVMKKLAKSATMATTTRGLQSTTYIPEFDLNQYSIKFRQCLPANKRTNSSQGSVLFHLCNSTTTCGDSCFANYDEYKIDIDSYLSSMVAYFKQQRNATCTACYSTCEPNNETIAVAGVNGDEETAGRRLAAQQKDLLDCDTCYDECEKIQNMEVNGYYDATDFLQCQMIYDPEDDDGGNLFAGPICSGAGSKITIGVFMDENCLELDSTKSVDDYLFNADGLQMKLSQALLKNTYMDTTCISCGDESTGNQTVSGLDLCQTLYNESSFRAASRSPLTGSSGADAKNGVAWNIGATMLLMFVGSLAL